MTTDASPPSLLNRFQQLERTLLVLAAVAIALSFLLDVATAGGLRPAIGAVAALGSLVVARRSANLAGTLLIVVSISLSIVGLVQRADDSTPGLALAGGLILSCGMVSATGKRPLAVLLVVAMFFALLLSNLVFVEAFIAFGATIVFWTFAAAAVGAGFYIRWTVEQRDRSINQARNSERIEMARELHDVVAHHVTGIVVQAQAGQFVAENDPQQAKRILAEIEQAGTEAMTSMRQLVETLRTGDNPLDASMNAVADLKELADSTRESGLEVTLAADQLPPALAPTIGRLTGEALTNTRRHSPDADTIHITIRTDSRNLVWSVSDNGKPKPPNPRPGYGIIGMTERVEALNGALTTNHDGQHWTVTATIPLETPR